MSPARRANVTTEFHDTSAEPASESLVDVVETPADAGRLLHPPLIVRSRLADFLPGGGPVEVERWGEGHSNVTFLVRRDDDEWVLRRPPRPPYPPRAHDVLRECAFISGLAGSDVPVPRIVLSCDDPGVIGEPFYVMERVDGHVIRDVVPEPLRGEGANATIADELIDGLVALHAADWRGLDLPLRGSADTYLARQVALWHSQWERNKVREVPAIDAVGRWLTEQLPATQRLTIVHGDYKLDNVVFAPDGPPRLAAILDWEMATVGDPLADLGFLAATWLGEGDPESLLGLSRVTASPGFPGSATLVERYAAATGLDVSALHWYQALALWKLAILLEGSYRRFRDGTDDDPFFATLLDGVPAVAELAHAHVTGERA